MNSDMVKPKKFGHLLLVYHFTVNQLGCLRKYFLLHILGNFSMINYLIINFIAERVGLDTFYGPDLFQKFCRFHIFVLTLQLRRKIRN